MTGEIFELARPGQGLLGGLLIGLAAALMLLGAGRIAGVSGIAARATGLGSGAIPLSVAWSFLLGLPLGALLVSAVVGVESSEFAPWPVLAAAGLLVGFGTRLGSGCTSGHGVCGLSRLSQRSLVATAVFMTSGIVTVLALRLAGIAP